MANLFSKEMQDQLKQLKTELGKGRPEKATDDNGKPTETVGLLTKQQVAKQVKKYNSEHLDDDKFSIILEAILEAMAEYYSLNLSDEVLKGMTEKAIRGGYQAAPPLGYEIKYAREIPKIKEDEAQIVRLIFDRFINFHQSPYEIAKELNRKE